jgi:hypothetical protein
MVCARESGGLAAWIEAVRALERSRERSRGAGAVAVGFMSSIPLRVMEIPTE